MKSPPSYSPGHLPPLNEDFCPPINICITDQDRNQTDLKDALSQLNEWKSKAKTLLQYRSVSKSKEEESLRKIINKHLKAEQPLGQFSYKKFFNKKI